MGKSQTETKDRKVKREVGSLTRDKAAELTSEVRELREGYESLIARIDETLAAGQTGDAPSVGASNGEEKTPDLEVYMLNLAVSGYTREEAATHLTEQFGESDDELLDKLFATAPIAEPPRRGRFRRRQ